MAKEMMYVDLTEFYKSVRKLEHKYIPEALVESFSYLAVKSRDKVRAETAIKFDLHSQYIPNAVKAIPESQSQKDAAMNSLQKKHDLMAAVYVRGANTPSKSLDFMVNHETGEDRTPHGSKLAVPMGDLREHSYRNARGAVAKRWKPENLLQRYKATGANYQGETTTRKGRRGEAKKGRVPGKAFIIKGKSGTPIIARRLVKNAGGRGGSTKHGLEFLYALVDNAGINKRWEFESTVHHTVQTHYAYIIQKWFKTIPDAPQGRRR